ncbi:hypothetical protein AB0L74_30395 [Streptomyces sp. NPDC052020]|uniref:hypothetical protein n=1 Tax=Streptomyces sp. NPDC052020 TaxID=3155677 RepID=UPI0034435100
MTTYSPIIAADGSKLCGIESCGRPHRVRGLCLAHGQRVRVHGHPQADKPLRSHASRNWKGEDVSYIGAHNRVTREHGKAAEWKCACGCGRQANDWAYLGTDAAAKVDETGRLYSVSPDHYAPLAKTCHRGFNTWQAQRRTGVPIGLVIAEALAA